MKTRYTTGNGFDIYHQVECANMRRLVKRLRKSCIYPPEGMEVAFATVISQCEMWTDNWA